LDRSRARDPPHKFWLQCAANGEWFWAAQAEELGWKRLWIEGDEVQAADPEADALRATEQSEIFSEHGENESTPEARASESPCAKENAAAEAAEAHAEALAMAKAMFANDTELHERLSASPELCLQFMGGLSDGLERAEATAKAALEKQTRQAAALAERQAYVECPRHMGRKAAKRAEKKAKKRAEKKAKNVGQEHSGEGRETASHEAEASQYAPLDQLGIPDEDLCTLEEVALGYRLEWVNE